MNSVLIKNSNRMNNHFKFAESEGWKKTVMSTYSLQENTVIIGQNKVNLFGNGSYFSNAPYITDGGFYDSDFNIKKNTFKDISKPILIKSRNALKIDGSVPYILINDYFSFVLDISGGLEEVWKTKVKSKTRNQVRKGEKNNYVVKIGKSELLDDFYNIISRAWLDLGTPTHSKKFYENIVSVFPNKDDYDANFLVLYLDEKPVSAACLINDSYSIHHPYAATLKEYNKLCMNNVLYWEIIKYGIEKKCEIFDLGRSKKNQGTEIYKLSWGAELVQLYYYYFNKKSHTNDEDGKFVQLAIKLWKKLPLSIATFLGPKLIYKVLK